MIIQLSIPDEFMAGIRMEVLSSSPGRIQVIYVIDKVLRKDLTPALPSRNKPGYI